MDTISVVKLKDAPELLKFGKSVPIKKEYMNTPFTSVFIGQKRVGKTSLLSNLITNPKLFNDYFMNISIISPTQELLSKFLDDKSLCWSNYTDDRLQKVIDVARENNENKDEKDRETLLILDDALASKALSSPLFMKLLSIHRNIGLSIIIAIQDIALLELHLRNLIDNFVVFRTNKSDRPLLIKALESPDLSKEQLTQLFNNPTVYDDPHTFVVFDKITNNIIKNFSEKLELK